MFKCNLGVVCDVFACGQGASGLDNIRPLEMRVESGSQLTYAAYASIYVSIRQRLRQHTRACSQHLLHCLLLSASSHEGSGWWPSNSWMMTTVSDPCVSLLMYPPYKDDMAYKLAILRYLKHDRLLQTLAQASPSRLSRPSGWWWQNYIQEKIVPTIIGRAMAQRFFVLSPIAGATGHSERDLYSARIRELIGCAIAYRPSIARLNNGWNM